MNFTKDQVLEACKNYGPSLLVVSPLLGIRVMASLASNESTYGINCGPRFEPAYYLNGSIYNSSITQRNLVKDFDKAAACSYGPWQMMFINFNGATVDQVLNDLTILSQEFVHFFNSYVIKARRAKTLVDIGQVWNCGHMTSTPIPSVAAYTQKLQAAYDSLEL